jgi:RNA polymerase sigma-70 factor (ECF subfamily)
VVTLLRRLRPAQASPVDETEAILIARARLDPDAFAPLYLRYVEEITRFCYVRLHDEDAARDAAQQVFERALAGLAGYRESGQFRAWLYTIARHVLANDARARRPTLPLESAAETVDPAAGPEEAATAALDRSALAGAIARLPEDQRLAIELRLAGLTGQEIAERMGRSHDAIKKLQLRAMERLRFGLGVGLATTEVRRGR